MNILNCSLPDAQTYECEDRCSKSSPLPSNATYQNFWDDPYSLNEYIQIIEQTT